MSQNLLRRIRGSFPWLISALAIAALPAMALAQAAPAATGASPGAAGAPPGEAQAAAVKAAEMAKPLTAADKKFIKDASELLYFELAVAEVALRRNRPTGAGRDATYRVAALVHDDLQKAWEELGKFAAAKNEKLREELGGVERRDVEEIRSVNFAKFHKEVVTSLAKTAKKLSDTFESPAIPHPVLKRIATTHAPIFKEHVKQLAQAGK